MTLFVWICVSFFVWICVCLFAFYSSCFWKVRIENWMCIYVALFGIPGTYQNVMMHASMLREQRRFPVEVIIISVLRYNCSIIALFFISSLNHRVFVCYFELIRYAWLYIFICGHHLWWSCVSVYYCEQKMNVWTLTCLCSIPLVTVYLCVLLLIEIDIYFSEVS